METLTTLACGSKVQLISEKRQSYLLDRILRYMSDSQGYKIEHMNITYSAIANDLHCIIKNDCNSQLYINGSCICVKQDELEECYKYKEYIKGED